MSPDSSPATASTSETSRRRLLALLGAGSAAGVAALMSGDDARAGHDGSNVFHLGQSNTNPAGATTSLHGNGNEALSIFGRLGIQSPPGGGAGLRIFGGAGSPILESNSLAPPDSASIAIHGTSPAIEGAGVEGSGAPYDSPVPGGAGTGIRGWSGTGRGVHGIAVGTGIGVEARCGVGDPSLPGGGPGSLDGHALLVRGRSAFTTVGSAIIPAGGESVFVSNAAVTNVSHIMVTLTSDPGQRQVRWVERSPGSGFAVHLSSAAKKQRLATQLTYMIVEPVAN